MPYGLVPCVRSKQIIRRKTCFPNQIPQQRHRRPMHAVNEVAYRHLRDANPLGKLSLGCPSRLKVSAKCFHTPKTIGFPYNFAIGEPYSHLAQNCRMAKPTQRSFLERALEALKDRYPKDRATQVRLAKIAGVSQPAVFEWGLQDRAPAHPTVLKLAHQLNVCVEWLYTGRGPKTPAVQADDPLSPVLLDWTNLDPETKKQIATYADFVRDSPRK